MPPRPQATRGCVVRFGSCRRRRSRQQALTKLEVALDVGTFRPNLAVKGAIEGQGDATKAGGKRRLRAQVAQVLAVGARRVVADDAAIFETCQDGMEGQS